jgi:hypothetical protein
VTEINGRFAVEAKEGQVCYVYGHLPVFQHRVSAFEQRPGPCELTFRNAKN